MMHWFKDLFSFFFWKWKVTNTCINFFLTALVPFLILSFEPVVVISNIFFYSNVTCIASMNKSHYLVSQKVYTVFLLYLNTIFLNELCYNASIFVFFVSTRSISKVHISNTFIVHISITYMSTLTLYNICLFAFSIFYFIPSFESQANNTVYVRYWCQ